MKITKAKIQTSLDAVVGVLSFLDGLVGGEVVHDATVIARMTEAAIKALGVILDAGPITQAETDVHIKALEDELADHVKERAIALEASDQAIDAAVAARFDPGEP